MLGEKISFNAYTFKVDCVRVFMQYCEYEERRVYKSQENASNF